MMDKIVRRLGDERWDESLNIHLDQREETESVSRMKRHHRIKSLTSAAMQMDWRMSRDYGVGLLNEDNSGKSLNICYMNGVIQCLANAPPFAQWLLNDVDHGECKL